MTVEMSKTQKRVVKLAGIACGDSYESAKLALEAKRIPGDGVPTGKTWRDAAKMTDAELLTALDLSLRPSAQELAEAADGDDYRNAGERG